MPEELNLQIDVAVLCQEIAKVETMCDKYNIVELDEILIKKEQFKALFFPFGENFGINKKSAIKPENIKFLSFLQTDRTVNNGKPFYLLDTIFTSLERDLNVSRNCFTVETRVALSKEISKIHSLCDLECCSVIESLTMSNIEDMISNYSKLNSNKKVTPIFVISVIFRTPTEGAKDVLIKFLYKIHF
jgi:hypothetical protein